jgi:RimJ/RimL family protein N-acetyltransferase
MDEPAYTSLIPLPDELRGASVLLRPYRDDDAEALFESIHASREHLRPWVSWVDRRQTIDDTREVVRRMMAQWLLREELALGIWEAASGRHLGECGLHHIDWRLRRFAIGYWLRASAEGRGAMTEAARLLIDFAFDGLRANRVELTCDALNTRSAAVAERLGFVREARLRNEELARDGTLRDTLVYALIPTDRA